MEPGVCWNGRRLPAVTQKSQTVCCSLIPSVCYSWITGIVEVAEVVFIRKRLPEVQYLHTTISDAQREEFANLVGTTIEQIQAGHFLPHSGIRFPQNPCTSCPYLGLCLGRNDLIESRLIRKPGADVGCFDELDY